MTDAFTKAHALTRRTLAQAEDWWLRRNEISYQATFILCLRAVYARDETDEIVEVVEEFVSTCKVIDGVKRWTKNGNDRLYFQGASSAYLDLKTGEIVFRKDNKGRPDSKSAWLSDALQSAFWDLDTVLRAA